MTHLGDHVAAYVDGQMADDEYAAALGHLGSCEECRYAVRAQQALKSRMSGLHEQAAPPASLMSALADPERLGAGPPRRSLLDRLLHHRGLRALVALTGASVTVTAVAYVAGAPVPAADGDPVSPPFDQFVASFSTTSDAILTPPRPQVSRTETVGATYRPAAASGLRLGGDSSEAVALLQEALGGERPVMLDLLLKNHDIVLGAGSESEDTTEVVAVRGGVRVASYWISRNTGQLVRTTTYDADGRPLRTAVPPSAWPSGHLRSTEDVVIGPGATAADAQTSADTIPETSLAGLDAKGWPCHDTLAGGLERVSGAWVGARGARLISLTYTDGVSALALFEQNGSLDRDALEGFTTERVGGADIHVRSGSPTVATWADDGVVYTVVTDAGDLRLANAIADLPRRDDAQPGVTGRIGAGIERLTAWADPMR